MIEIVAILVAELCYMGPQKEACEAHITRCMFEGRELSEDLIESCTKETLSSLREDSNG